MTAKRTVRGRTTRAFPSGNRYDYWELTDILKEHEAGAREARDQAGPDVSMHLQVDVAVGNNVGNIVSRIEGCCP